MPNYRELLNKATEIRTDRNAFEVAAVKKAVELHNALTEQLVAPADAVVTHPLEARPPGEIDLGSGYILTRDGVRFGISVQLDKVRLGEFCNILPLGDRLFAKLEGREPIDVSDATGVALWCDAMEQIFDEKLDRSLNGEISALMKKKVS